MNSLLDSELCARLALALGHFVWQGALIAFVAASIAALLRRASANTRCVVWLTALIAMSLAPVITFGVVNGGRGSSRQFALSDDIEEIRRAEGRQPPDNDRWPESPGPDGRRLAKNQTGSVASQWQSEDLALAGSRRTTANESIETLPAPSSSAWQRLAPWTVGAYLVGVCGMLVRLAVGLWGGRALRKRSTPIRSDALADSAARIAKALGLRLAPALAWCDEVAVPTVIGVLRPTILLPLSLTSGLAPEQVEAVLAHELAHLRRWDHLVNVLQRVVESLLFFHPAVWWVSSRVRLEREHACDDLAVSLGTPRLAYAASLLRVAELSRLTLAPPPATLVSLLATDGKPSKLRQRIARLLGETSAPQVRLRPASLMAVIGVVLIGSCFAARLALTEESPLSPVSPSVKTDTSAGRGSPDPALDSTAGLPNSDDRQSKTGNVSGDLRSNPATGSGDPRRAQGDSEVAFVHAPPTPDDEQRLLEELRRSLPEGWVVERRFGGYWIDRRRRVFGKHFRETPDVMLHFAKELDVPETPPMEGEFSFESLGLCRFGYCMAAIREDFRGEWPAIKQRVQSVLPAADLAATKSADDPSTEIAVAGRLLFDDGQPVIGALVGPMFRKKIPLGNDGRFKLRVAPEWSRFRIHLLDASGWPSPRQWPRKAEHKGEVLDVMLPRLKEPFAVCDIRLDRSKLRTVKLLWKGEPVAARVSVHTYPSVNWLTVREAPGNDKPEPGGRKPSLNVARTLDVILRPGETLTIPDVAPGDGTLRIVPIKSKRTLLWNLFGDERDERLEHDPTQVGSVEFRITGAVEADAQESPLAFMLSRIMPGSAFGFGSAFYNPTDPYRLEFDPKAESYRVSNLQPGSYHVMLFPEGGTSSGPVTFTITAGQTEKIDLPTPKAAGSGDPRRAPQESQKPKGKEAQSLFKKWQEGARANGNIPGGALGPLVRVMTKFVKNNPTHEGAPKFAELLKRIDVSRDWTPAEAVALLDEVTAIYASLPEWVEGEPRFTLGGAIQTGQPLPDELKNAPWGEAQPNGLRVAWLLEPRALKYRLGTPLKSRILFHNAGKDAVVFRALTWNQSGSHKAHDANGEEINILSVEWTTIPRTIACRLAPGEFLEVTAAGIGVGANKDAEDWRGTRVGSWIEAKAGDEVTFTPDAVDCDGRDGPHPEDDAKPAVEKNWWLQFIKDRLSLDRPLPADAGERRRLLDRATRDLFGNAPTAEEITAFTTDAAPEALDALAKRLANRAGFAPFSGSLKSGTRKFLVLPVDPEAAKKPRTAKNPGQYKLGGNATLVVTRRPIGERIVNEAHIAFAPTDATKPAPREPHPVPLPDGYNTWAAAWERGATVLWVQQKGTVRSYDFTNPAKVQETQLAEPDFDKVPKPILEALRAELIGDAKVIDAPKGTGAAQILNSPEGEL